MPDNVIANSGSGGPTFATDEIAGVHYPRSKVTFGADGVSTDVSATDGLPVAPVDLSTQTSFGPITAANTVLFTAVDTSGRRSIVLQLTGLWGSGIFFEQSNDNTNWLQVTAVAQASDVVTVDAAYGPDIYIIPVVARYFRARTFGDFSGSVSGSYTLRTLEVPPFFQNNKIVDVDPAVSMPVAGNDPQGYTRRIAVTELGHIIPADGRVLQGSRTGAGVILQGDATGYGTLVFQAFNGFGTPGWNVAPEFSNDGATWTSAQFWNVSGGSATSGAAASAGLFVTPVLGRFFRFRCTSYATGAPSVIAVLKQGSFFPPLATAGLLVTTSNASTNVAQIGGTAPVTAGVAGMLAVGGNIAEDTAATSNPLICGGVARTALPASTIIAGDAIRNTLSVSGQLITKQNAPGDLDFFANVTVTTNAQTAIRAAQGAGVRQNVTVVTYQNTNATATTLTIQDGSTTLVTFSVPASMTEPRQLVFPTPLRGTANTALNYTAGTTGANVLLNVTGFNSY